MNILHFLTYFAVFSGVMPSLAKSRRKRE